VVKDPRARRPGRPGPFPGLRGSGPLGCGLRASGLRASGAAGPLRPARHPFCGSLGVHSGVSDSETGRARWQDPNRRAPCHGRPGGPGVRWSPPHGPHRPDCWQSAERAPSL